MIPFYILLAGLIYLLYQEVKFLVLYINLKKDSSPINMGELSGVIQPHNKNPIYNIKIVDDPLKRSIKLKTTILSSLVPRLMGKTFKVIVNQDYSFCIINNPFPILFSFCVLSFGFIILINLSHLKY